MVTDVVKLARLKNEQEFRAQILGFIAQPAVLAVLVFTLIEILQSVEVNNQPLMGSISGSALETALGLNVVLGGLGSLTSLDGLGSIATLLKVL